MTGSVRTWALVVAIAAFVGSIAALVGVWGPGIGEETVVVVAALSLIAGAVELGRTHGDHDRTSTPDPERRTPVPVPGTDVASAVDQFRPSTRQYVTSGRRVTGGLRHAAVAVLTRFEGLGAEDARARIEDGTWTDDSRAAAFLAPDGTPSRSIGETISSWTGRSSTFRLDVRRTAAAVAAIGYAGLDERTAPEAIPAYEPADDDEVEPRTTSNRPAKLHERPRRETGHWAGIGVVALAAIGVGAAAESPGVVLAGVVAVGYAAFANSTAAPQPSIDVERTLSDESPEPDDDVDVAVTITNESDRPLADLRFVDGVPPALAVTDGSARIGTALRPGESVTLEYTVVARPGTHTFDPALAIVRDLSRSSERQFLVPSETELVCEHAFRPTAASVPRRPTATTFAGRLTSREGGAGTEFHSVREYRPSDPLNRIDWNRHARTGELATLEFHEERAARVLLLVDARKASYVAPDSDSAHAVDRATDAAGRIAATLLEAGDTVGVAAIGPTNRTGSGTVSDSCWLAPGSGQHHRNRLRKRLATHPQFSSTPPESEGRWLAQLRRIRRRLSAETQVVVFTPLIDRASVSIARRLTARGHPVTVVSPDATADRTAGQQLARVGRRINRFDLQRAGVPVVDWRADETIDEALARTNAGGGRR